MNYMITRNGHRFDLSPARIGSNRIELDDVATALAKQCCYRGHCPGFLSLAEFSILVSHLAPASLALHGLLRFSSSAYLGYTVSPNQIKSPDLRAAEHLIERHVGDALGVPQTFGHEPTQQALRDAVKRANAICLDTLMGHCYLPPEITDLVDHYYPDGIPPWLEPRPLDWQDARLAFLDRYHSLMAITRQALETPDNIVPLHTL